MPWFEDIQIGKLEKLGAHTFTEAEIIAFARQYDPQPFHIDPIAALKGPFGGLVASGWHTAATWMSFIAARQQSEQDDGTPRPGPSPGFLDLRWPNPVRPGDTIHFTSVIIEKIEPRTRPWGITRQRGEGTNQRGELVFSFIGQGILTRRHPPVLPGETT